MLVSIVIFIVAVALAGAVFFYNEYLVSEIENRSIILDKEKGGLDLALIQELSRFDSRTKSAKQILDKHVSLISLFDFLEENTLKGVMFDSFDFDVKKNDLILELKGVADSYATIALQSDIFGKNKNIIDPIFSDLGVNFSGEITFSVSSKIEPRLISYKENL